MSKSGLHNKPAGCGAAEAYDSGPGSEEEEEIKDIIIDFNKYIILRELWIRIQYRYFFIRDQTTCISVTCTVLSTVKLHQWPINICQNPKYFKSFRNQKLVPFYFLNVFCNLVLFTL
jgi:hypothetical protein